MTILACRFFLLVSFGFGLSSLGNFNTPELILLIGIGFLLYLRGKRQVPLFFIPDALLVSLPYFWAMNAVDGFSLWQPGFTVFFAISLGFAGATFLIRRREGTTWKISELELSLFFSFFFFAIFSTVLKALFKPFSLDDYRRVISSAFLFFGGIPICQAASIGLFSSAGNSDPS